MENAIPLQGEGEQSTKFGGPCPYWLQPPLCCTFENVFPAGAGVGVAGGAGSGGGGLFEAASCSCWCLSNSLVCESVKGKIKLSRTRRVPGIDAEPLPQLPRRG